MTRHMLDGPQYPETLPEGVPEGIETVLTKALVRAPEQRLPSAGALVAALTRCQSQPEQPQPTVKPPAALEAPVKTTVSSFPAPKLEEPASVPPEEKRAS